MLTLSLLHCHFVVSLNPKKTTVSWNLIEIPFFSSPLTVLETPAEIKLRLLWDDLIDNMPAGVGKLKHLYSPGILVVVVLPTPKSYPR